MDAVIKLLNEYYTRDFRDICREIGLSHREIACMINESLREILEQNNVVVKLDRRTFNVSVHAVVVE